MQESKVLSFFGLMILISTLLVVASGQSWMEQKRTTPFEKKLPEFGRPDKPNYNEIIASASKHQVVITDNNNNKECVYQPGKAFRLVISKERFPEVKPDKDVFGIITLRVTPDYHATSKVIYAKEPYKFDRLNWAMRTGWNDVIPLFSRLSYFKEHLKPFSEPVYAHFYILDTREYPEYPGQHYHWPRENLEDYYFYILEKIDLVASNQQE